MLNADHDVVILGAGAAGLMCAIEAGKRGRRVLLLEHADRVGKKILISGGGRCNFTNLHCKPENFISANPHFAKSALARYTPADFIALVESYGIAYHEKTLGQLFCDDSAKQIVAMLLNECAKAEVRVVVGTNVREDRPRARPGFVVSTGRFKLQKRRRWSSPPAAFRFRRWAPPDLATTSRDNLAFRFANLALRSFRSCSVARSTPISPR